MKEGQQVTMDTSVMINEKHTSLGKVKGVVTKIISDNAFVMHWEIGNGEFKGKYNKVYTVDDIFKR